MFPHVRRAIAALCCGLSFIACSDASVTSTSGAVSSLTGVTVSASALVAAHGCGPQAGRVYKYVAVLYDAAEAPGATGAIRAAATYDCYADALFANLTSVGVADFTVAVYAYDAPAFIAHADAIASALAATGGDSATLALHATYLTRCSAAQQPGVTVAAICDPLTPH